MDDRTRLMLVWPVAGFFVAMAFGIGLISMAVFETRELGPEVPAAATGAPASLLDVKLGDLFIQPKQLHADAGALTINVRNSGGIEHNFSLGSLGKTPMIEQDGSATLEIASIEPGTYGFQCDVPGHAEGGMTGTLVVGDAEGEAAGSTRHAPDEHSMSAEEMARHDASVTAKFPADTKGEGGIDLERQIADDGTSVFRLTADETRWEVSPGETKEAMAYNGIIPGPAIRAEIGDRVRIVLHNELEEPTTLHFHGLVVPADMDGVPVISQEAVLPGESFTYEFTVRNSGTNMYHSHFNAQSQVPKGLLGPFIVRDPKDPPADVDYNMVLNDGPLGFTLNGKGFPATQPLAVKQGQTIRIRYMNEGFQIHPMHLHGLVQTVIAKDGHLLMRPYRSDTVLVGPGERYDVLVKASELGAWAWHCHVLNHAESEQGMFGMVTAVIVEK